MLSLRTAREITRINYYEREWRNKTNIGKFTVIPLATRSPAPLLVEDDIVDYKVSWHGYTSHVTERLAKGKQTLSRLYHFRDLDAKKKLHLVKALVIPVLLYSPVPLHTLSNRSISRLQKIQNAAIRFVFKVKWDDFTTSEELHTAASLPAVNVRLHSLAEKTWEKMVAEEWEQVAELLQKDATAPNRSQSWFPRSLQKLRTNPNPIPKYL